MRWPVDKAFGIVPLWVTEAKISDRAVRLYALLSGLRDYGTDMATLGRNRLARDLNCSTDSLDRAKAELEEVGAISVVRVRSENGALGINAYKVHREHPDSRTGAATAVAAQERIGGVDAESVPSIDERSSSSGTNGVDPRAVRVPSGSEEGADHVVNVRARNGRGSCTCEGFKFRKECRHIPIARDMLGLSDLAKREPQRVGGKLVRSHEHDLTDEILAVFNEATGKRFAGVEWRRAIIGRIREHPELTLADHRRVIEQQMAAPWWKGDPTPAVIYGKGSVFDSALNGVARVRSGQENTKDDGFDAYN